MTALFDVDDSYESGWTTYLLSPSAQHKFGQALTSASVRPEQFYDSPRRAYRAQGEMALMAAVLEHAIKDFYLPLVKSGVQVQRLAQDAEEWLFNDGVEWPFSFVNICAALGLEPTYVRRGLIQWKEHQSKQSPPPRQRALTKPLLGLAA